MELIFIKEPIIGILALIIAALDVLVGLSRLPRAASLLITGVNILLHAACLTLIMLRSGGYEGALILVLMSGAITLAMSPKPEKPNEKPDSEVKR